MTVPSCKHYEVTTNTVRWSPWHVTTEMPKRQRSLSWREVGQASPTSQWQGLHDYWLNAVGTLSTTYMWMRSEILSAFLKVDQELRKHSIYKEYTCSIQFHRSCKWQMIENVSISSSSLWGDSRPGTREGRLHTSVHNMAAKCEEQFKNKINPAKCFWDNYVILCHITCTFSVPFGFELAIRKSNHEDPHCAVAWRKDLACPTCSCPERKSTYWSFRFKAKLIGNNRQTKRFLRTGAVQGRLLLILAKG